MPDERVDLPQRERDRRPAVEVAFEKAIGRDAEFEGRGGGVLDDGGAVRLDEREDAEDAADSGSTVVLMDVVTDGPN